MKSFLVHGRYIESVFSRLTQGGLGAQGDVLEDDWI